MSRTGALFYGAYRQLNARKLFWITLGISGLVVVLIGALGIDEDGVHLFSMHPASTGTETMSPEVFYKSLFSSLGIGIWLSWIAAILALVSTAGIFPDMINGGGIDLLLCRPVSRFRLFLTQYLGGLLFVVLQVGLFTAASFLVIGIRGGAWEPALFLAIPLVTCFFSYLYAVCVLLGVLTRSTLAAVLLTILFWFLLWVAGSVEDGCATAAVMAAFENERLEEDIKKRETDADDPLEQAELAAKIHRRDQNRRTLKTVKQIGGIFQNINAFLPKTGRTIALLQRWLISLADLPDIKDDSFEQRLIRKQRSRSAVFIIGTSLAFEAVVLLLGAWVFCRRDY